MRAVPAAARWEAIVAGDGAPSAWTAARKVLSLSVRQAVWSSGTKLLLWHWSQPLSNFAVFGVYFCALPVDDGQREFGTNVAAREVAYMVTTQLALWLNPAYLLMELGSVWKEDLEAAEAAGGGCGRCARWLRSVDSQALQQRAVYLLAPHHYITACLMRRAESTPRRGGGEMGALWKLFSVVGCLKFFGDLFSAFALVRILQQPEPPAAPAIGCWLTTAGLVAGATGGALMALGVARTGRELGWDEWAVFGLFGLVLGVPFCSACPCWWWRRCSSAAPAAASPARGAPSLVAPLASPCPDTAGSAIFYKVNETAYA